MDVYHPYKFKQTPATTTLKKGNLPFNMLTSLIVLLLKLTVVLTNYHSTLSQNFDTVGPMVIIHNSRPLVFYKNY